MWKNLTHMEKAGPRDKRGWTQNKVGGPKTAETVKVLALIAMIVFRSEVVTFIPEQSQSLE